jgi:hypothetical protein
MKHIRKIFLTHKINTFNFQYIVCICMVLLAELGLGVLFLLYHNNFGSDIEGTKLTATLQTQYGFDQAFTKSMDFAQSRVRLKLERHCKTQ